MTGTDAAVLTRRRPEWGGVFLIGYRVIWLWIGVQSGTPLVPPASNWNEKVIAD